MEAFVTYLSTDSFLPGILVLYQSIGQHHAAFNFLVLVKMDISGTVGDRLLAAGINFKIVAEIKSPFCLSADDRNFQSMFSKLNIFALVEFEKVVYLDADMLICQNLDPLFQYPHMSAVAAGGLLPQNRLWKALNAGLLVITPDAELFGNLCSSLHDTGSVDGSDQGFLQQFYSRWPAEKQLHLDHKYNVPVYYLDEYCRSHGFSFSYRNGKVVTDVAVIHYWGRKKPWDSSNKKLPGTKTGEALKLWHDTYQCCPK